MYVIAMNFKSSQFEAEFIVHMLYVNSFQTEAQTMLIYPFF